MSDLKELKQLPVVQEIDADRPKFVTGAMVLTIKDVASYELAMKVMLEAKVRIKSVEDKLNPFKKKAYDAYKSWPTLIDELTKDYKAVERYLKKIAEEWSAAERRRIKEEEDRKREEQRQREEEERLAEAERAEKEGRHDDAEIILETPQYTPPVILEPEIPKVKGISYVTRWRYRISNKALIPKEYLVVDEKAIQKVVDALKDKCNIPGVEVYPEETISGSVARAANE